MGKKIAIVMILALGLLLCMNVVQAKTYLVQGGEAESQTIYGDTGDDITIELKSADQPVNLYIMTFSEYLEFSTKAEDTKTHSVSPNDYEIEVWVTMYGKTGDNYDIELSPTSQPVTLILSNDIIDWRTKNAWKMENVSSGKWSWTQPSDDSYTLYVVNDNSQQVSATVRVTNLDKTTTFFSQEGVSSGTWTWKMPSDDMYELVIENPNSDQVTVDAVIGGGSILNEGEGCGSFIIGGILVCLLLMVLMLQLKKRMV